jgi:hypothetical protein
MAVEISNALFMSQLGEIRKIKQFLFEERVAFPPAYLPSIDLGALNAFTLSGSGREPTVEEWESLDAKLTALISMLDDNQRWKMRVHELAFFFKTMPLIFLGLSVFFATFYVLYQTLDITNAALRTACFLFAVFGWTVSQGAMGACAFLGVGAANRKPAVVVAAAAGAPAAAPAASSTAEAFAGDSVDLTNRNLLTIRVVLGAVFAFLLAAPISFQGLAALSATLKDSNSAQESVKITDAANYALILAPFLFGFSTSLVLALLNRFLETIKTLMGVNKSPAAP